MQEYSGGFAQGLSQWWDGIVNTFTGTDGTDHNGNPVRVGGYPSIINGNGNAETYNGTIHFTNTDTYNQYLSNQHWQDHEEGHIMQNFTLWKDLPSYWYCYNIALESELLGTTTTSTGGITGHDGNLWEMLAEEYAWEKEGR